MSGLTGRFLTRDPIGYDDGENLYQYVAGKPLVAMDPTGEYYVYCRAVRGFWGYIFRHCEIKKDCTPGYVTGPGNTVEYISCHEIRIDDDKKRTLPDGTLCSNASEDDIKKCLLKYPSGRPLKSEWGSNCQSDTILSLSHCCMKSGWWPNEYAGPHVLCLRGHIEKRQKMKPFRGGGVPSGEWEDVFVCDEYLPDWRDW